MKKAARVALKYFIVPLVLLCVLAAFCLLSYRAYAQRNIRERTRITSSSGIESLEEVTLGGIKQWISIRGWDRSNPVLLHLHGGPGGGEIAVSRFFNTELERHFVVVNWDQRGAGKSHSRDIPVESMNIEQFIVDARDLAEMLKARFNVPGIYLVGHSWGSMLGALVVSRYPELFYAFVGVGQFVEDIETEEISYRFTLEKATESGNEDALTELGEIGPPPYDDYRKMWAQRRWLQEFGGVIHTDIGNLWWMGATSPDCSLIDGLRYSRGQAFSSEHMWDEVSRVNLFRQAPRIEVPVYFFVGRHDYNTPFEIAERYYEQLEAPRGKQIIWFENSAHMIPYEEPKKYSDMLINRVLNETYHPLLSDAYGG